MENIKEKKKRKPIRFDIAKNDFQFAFTMKKEFNIKMIEVAKTMQISRAEVIRMGINKMFESIKK